MKQPLSPQRVSFGFDATKLGTIISLGMVLAFVGLKSSYALLAVLFNGGVAIAILAAALGLGAALLQFIVPRTLSATWSFLATLGVGLGGLSLTVLALGSMGVLNRGIWLAVTALLIVFGVWRAARLIRRSTETPDPAPVDSTMRFNWLLLLIIPFAAYALLAASMPPGILWPGEGGGYDALEYHLGAPRDYVDAGRIGYLPHNIYANFPANAEMLYLLAMILHGDPVQAALTCQMLHALLAGLAVAAIWLAGREFSRMTGRIAAIVAGTSPFLVYLSGLAYVENWLLFFSAMSLAAAIRAFRETNREWRWSLMAGLLAGFACGCKYTGVVATAFPIFIVLCAIKFWKSLFSLPLTTEQFGSHGRPSETVHAPLRGDIDSNAISESRRNRLAGVSPLIFFIGVSIAFSPWLIKNYRATGNPVFPLGYSVFGANEGVWTDTLAAQWERGHQPAAKDRPVAARMARLVDQVLKSDFFGPMIAAGIICGILLFFIKGGSDERRLQYATMLSCGMMIVVGLAVWVGFTHLVDRFAYVLIAPCAVLCGLASDRIRAKHGVIGTSKVVLALFLLSIYNLDSVWTLFSIGKVDADPKAPKLDVPYDYALGRADLMVSDSPVAPPHLTRINRELRNGSHVLIVADAKRFYFEKGADYCVVFNRNPFAEAADRLTPSDLIAWLREGGYYFVYVDWLEMARLQNSYGFWPSVNVGLFESLTKAGLKPVDDFSVEPGKRPYGTLFQVP